MWNLHYSEWRILAEGMRVRSERQENEQKRAEKNADYDSGTGGYKTREQRERSKRAADNAASDLSREMEMARKGNHPDQQGQQAA